MAWTGTILNGVGGYTKIAANGAGDLQLALRRSVKSHIQLIGDVSVNNNVASFANAINVMAKYKPFKNANAAFSSFNARNTARATARYGMATPPSFSPTEFLSAPGNVSEPPGWTYDRPVSITNGEVTILTPLRADDFIKDRSTADAGYDPNAVPPIFFEMPELAIRGGCVAMIWKDQSVDHLYAAPLGWVADRSLSVDELLTGNSADYYKNMSIALCLFRYNAAGTAIDAANVIVSSLKFGDISSSGNPGMIYFNGGGQGTSPIDNKRCPTIDLLNSNVSDGRRFLVVACLSATGVQDPTNSYEVLPNNYTFFSLGFDITRLTDRASVIAAIAGSINKISAVFATSGPRLVLRDSSTDWYKYEITGLPIQGLFTTAQDYQNTSAFDVTTQLYVPGGCFDAPPGEAGSTPTKEVTINSVTFANAGQTYTKNLVTAADNIGYVYIYKDAAKQVVATASYKYGNTGDSPVVNFNNTLTITP